MMIKKLHFQNFKSIRDNEIHLAPLTFFTGLNSSGKSSFSTSLIACWRKKGNAWKNSTT